MSVLGRCAVYLKPVVERFPPVAKFFRYAWDNWQMFEEPQDTPMGFKFVGHSTMQSGCFEPEETELVKRLLQSVDVVINIGANIGYYCCFALKAGRHVVAFEPVGSNLRYLYKNIKANHWEDRIEIFPMALTNRTGIIDIFGGGTGASLIKGWAGTPEYLVDTVPVSTLDNVLGCRFHGQRCFVLVDIEGAERMMLEGASKLLSASPKPIWMVEIVVTAHQPKGVTLNPDLEATFKWFWDHGYEAFTADKHMRLVSPSEVGNIVATGQNTLESSNFLFIEKGRNDVLLR